MSRQLVILEGPESGRTIPLDDNAKLTLGRGQASCTRLNDPQVSRVHCTLEVNADGVLIADAGSTGGTFVQGKRIDQQRLSPGDEIRIGTSRLRFEADSDAVREGTTPARVPAFSARALDELAGKTLGDFELQRVTHRGDSSVLFRGHDHKHDRPAVIKVMLPSVMSDEEQRARFVRAVHAMINVRHNNLVEVYGAGKQGPFCWCAMEYVDGIRVVEMIELIGQQGRLDWREVYRIAVHVTRALECAYANKVIHRNVTPENLIQRKNDKVVKLCDLMLAKALEGTQARQVTAPGQLIGNVAYMSPERMVDTSNLDWRSDQYGLGATLYALLTGKPPFESSSLGELVQAIHNQKAAFPPEVEAETNEAFRTLVLKMLEKSPADRHTFPSELLRRLDEIGKQSSVDADVLYNQ